MFIMKDNEEEEEIKIEYFDSVEVDPLHDYGQYIEIKDSAERDTHSVKLNHQKELLQNYCQYLENDTPLVEYEEDNAIAPKIVSWHKHVDEFGRYVCKFCDLSYSTVQTLRYHVRVKHTHDYNNIKNTPISNKRQYKAKCHICKKVFKNINDLQKHSDTHGLNNTENTCLLCLETFKEHIDLLNHMTNKHASLKKLHICTTCGYSTPKVSNYKKHINVHTGRNKQKCAYCDYTTNYKPNMKIHERIHGNEKLYACGIGDCEYCCKTLPALRSHQLMHNKEKHMLYCDKCSYSTIYKINLKKHIDSHWRKKLGNKNT